MRTFSLRAENIKKDWYLVDAEGQVLGRLAARIAAVLRGKHKPTFSPHLDMGDCVVVTNAEKIVVTGAKETQKNYRHHSGFPGGQNTKTLETIRKRHPERIIENAVRGMLPHNRLGRKMLKHLKVYTGPDHPHQAQQPQPLDT
ncbi:MAG: 50S ribosomal protein L13 [Fidelibacterota bacterium]|nr:MAG: 50S ribosomal protein L13 [Candidatus Neomarinimicrobiota bacterium]